MAGQYSLKIDQGTTFHLVFFVKTDSNYWNLTGYSAVFKIRKDTKTGAVLKTITSASGALVLGTVNGRVQIGMSATETALLPEGRHVYDVELTSSSSEVTRILEGRVLVSRNG
jgi:hypothetical protein